MFLTTAEYFYVCLNTYNIMYFVKLPNETKTHTERSNKLKKKSRNKYIYIERANMRTKRFTRTKNATYANNKKSI